MLNFDAIAEQRIQEAIGRVLAEVELPVDIHWSA